MQYQCTVYKATSLKANLIDTFFILSFLVFVSITPHLSSPLLHRSTHPHPCVWARAEHQASGDPGGRGRGRESRPDSSQQCGITLTLGTVGSWIKGRPSVWRRNRMARPAEQQCSQSTHRGSLARSFACLPAHNSHTLGPSRESKKAKSARLAVPQSPFRTNPSV